MSRIDFRNDYFYLFMIFTKIDKQYILLIGILIN